MENQELKRVIAARQILIEGHDRVLDGGTVPDVAMCKQRDVAKVLLDAIAELDGLLRDNNVTFSK